MKYLNKKNKEKSNGKKKKRARTPYAALKPELNLKIRYNEISDFDYLHKLSPKEKQWLNDFVEGSINANRKSPLFKTKKEWKKNEDRNNERNRCMMSRAQARNNLSYFTELTKSKNLKIDEWDAVINGMDKNKVRLKKKD